MIFHLHCGLSLAGYSAVGLLLGAYLQKYTDADELDLGLVFMIQPMTVFLRPLVCAHADRYRAHKRLLAWSLLGTSLAYLPHIAIPYLIKYETLRDLLSLRAIFWTLVVCHLLGCVCFCGIRALGDAVTNNYAKRTQSDYANFRKWGSLSFGLCGYLLGHVNQGSLLPDFVPSMIVYSLAMATECILVYLWPEEHFYIVGDQSGAANSSPQLMPLPTGRQVWSHMRRKLWRTLTCRVGRDKDLGRLRSTHPKGLSVDMNRVDQLNSATETAAPKAISAKTQAKIFILLLRFDYRIMIYLLILLYAGLVGFSGINFVFTHMNQMCHERGTCNGAALAGLMMMLYCILETFGYVVLDAFRHKLKNRILLLEVTLVSVAVHYYFYGFVLEHVSPYFFLIECLHGLEYSVSQSTCMEFGYKFANEVDHLMPELLRRGIIGEDDDHELVKVSLMATMSGCFTLVYDGFGTSIGSLAIGVVVHNYSFKIAWVMIGSLAVIGFSAILIGVLVIKVSGVRPPIEKLRQTRHEHRRSSVAVTKT